MATQNRVFVSPGVFTLERDLSFVVRQVGVTTLGIAGETRKGPAFQPIFIQDYNEFQSYFGGLDPCKFQGTGYPKYEAPYIAKSYLNESNQLFVTRILGLSGYRAGDSWVLSLSAAPDPATQIITTSAVTFTVTYIAFRDAEANIQSFEVTSTGGTFVETLFDEGFLDSVLTPLTNSTIGTGSLQPFVDVTDIIYRKDEGSNTFTGVTFDMTLLTLDDSAKPVTGTTSGTVTTYLATGYTDIDDCVIGTLKSTADYDAEEILNFSITGGSGGVVIADNQTIYGDPLDNFNITGLTADGDPINLNVSLDRTKKNFISRVFGERCNTCNLTSGPLYIEELYINQFEKLVLQDKVWGVNSTFTHVDGSTIGDGFDNFLTEYKPAQTPYIVSELRGNKLFRLFKFWTISDGNAANSDVKISIANIDPDNRTFDILIRAWGDTDANPVILERFSRVTMNSNENNYVARRIGTVDGNFESRSRYVQLEMADGCLDDAFPAGFEGYPVRDYDPLLPPKPCYKTSYNPLERKRRVYLGISDITGFDQDLFDFKGIPSGDLLMWTGTTDGYHLDSGAGEAQIDGIFTVVDTGGTIFTPTFSFEVGCCEFRNNNALEGTDYEKINARKFTLVPYGGFDGWDIYRDQRTNQDTYRVTNIEGDAFGTKGDKGILSEVFDVFANSDGDTVITSDYYAYLQGIRTFANPEETNINILTTPGIDTILHSNIVEETIDMVETERCDSLYLVTTPDVGAGTTDQITPEDIANQLDGLYDSNYTATYYPWVQFNDTENNVFIWLPATYSVVRNMALTDNISFPWFATAGVNRGNVTAEKARKKLSQDERDTLYENRINPIATFNDVGVVIWGNKTLQVRESALDRINVRRLLLRARKLISAVSVRLLFEQNDDIVRNQFLGLINPILDNIRRERGLTDFRVVLDNSPEAIDRGELCGQIFIKPTRTLEFICVEFVITNTGASFDDI